MPDGTQAGRTASASLLTWPNLITFGRLCAVPLAFWLVIQQRYFAAFILFCAAGASDAVDGWLARRNGGGNRLGALLDPVADKALLVTMYVTLAAVGALPSWLATLVVFRDLVIVGGVITLAILGTGVAIKPLYISKINTAMQIILVAATLLVTGLSLDRGNGVADVLEALTWSVAATTFASGTAYVWVTVRSSPGF